MADGHSEIVHYLDKKLTGISVDFSVIHADIGELKSELTELRERVEAVYDGLDAYAKRADTYFQEMLMLSKKVDRHEVWLHQVAEKLGLKLEY